MKQLKFLKTISCEGIPVWFKDCCYDVLAESESSSGLGMYKLFCEDLKLRGIDKICEGSLFIVLEIPQPDTKKEEKQIVKSKRKKSQKIEPKD